MSGKIPKDFIQQLLARADLQDLIGHRIDLKRAGHIYKACCPFHQEKTPSFSVDPVKQFYYCFGCHAHGNAIDFLIQYDHLSFVEAVEELARIQGVEVPTSSGGEKAESQDHIFKILDQASQFYQAQLRQPELAAAGIEYIKGRGLNGEIAKEFAIGFAPAGWNHLEQFLQSRGFSQQNMLDAGLVVRGSKGNLYDRFRNRVIFPIRNRRGQTIGFGGRMIDPNDNPKYLNSPETPVFHKGQELYGLFEATQRLRKIDRLFAVEGYMDVVSLAQFGIHNSVATLGTAVTTEHLQKVFRICDELVFSFDGDSAGRKAAWKALEISLPLLNGKRQAKFLFFPDQDDPDSFIRSKGTDAFELALQQATPLSKFFFDQLGSVVDLSSIDGRSKLVELAKPLIQQIQNEAYREMMLQQLAELVRLPNENVAKMVPSTHTPMEPRPLVRRPNNKGSPSAIRSAILLLIHEPSLGQQTKETDFIRTLTEPGANLLSDMVEYCHQSTDMSTGQLLENFRDHEYATYLAKLAGQPMLLETNLTEQWVGTIETLRRRSWEQELQILKDKDRRGEELSMGEKTEMVRLVQVLFHSRAPQN